MAWLTGYRYRKKLVLDHAKVDADLPWFPIPAPMGASVGLTDADVTEIFNEVGDNYLKIAVTKADGLTQLYVEIECWSAANSKALPWFSKSDWSVWTAQDTEVYFYFDASAADNTGYVGAVASSPAQNVWDNDYVLVCHLAQDPSAGAGSIKDSTPNAQHLTPHGSMTAGDLVDALIGKGLDFDEIDDYLTTTLSISQKALTYEALVYPRSGGGGNYGRICDNGKTDLAMGDGQNATFLVEINGGNNFLGSSVMAKNAWHTAVAHVNGNSYAELDGTDTGDVGSGGVDANNSFAIASWISGGRLFDGIIAEIRYSKVERSAAWRKLFHHCMTDNVITWGATEYAGGEAIEDLSLNLSAYYQSRDDIVAALEATDGTAFENLETFLKALGRSIEDLGFDLSAYLQGREDLPAFLKAVGLARKDLPAALRALGQDRQDLATYQKTVAWARRHLATFLSAVDPLVLQDLAMALSATDGTVRQDLYMHLAAIKQVPQYRSVVAQRVQSVISEVT